MRNTFPTKEQLEGMSLVALRLLDIQETDEEELVQEVIKSKEVAIPPLAKVFRGDFPDIMTPEQEAEYQKKVNERAGVQPIVSEVNTVVVGKEETAEPEKKVFKCENCGKEVKTQGALRMHIGRFHKK